MTEIRPNFPLYQQELGAVADGEIKNIFVWRQNTFNNWDNKCAQRCTPLHLRTINFMWRQEKVNAPDETPEFTYADSVSSFNIRANNNEFPMDKLENKDYTLNDLRLKDPPITKQEGDAQSDKILILRNVNGTQTTLDKEIEPFVVRKIMAEVAGSDTIAQRFLDSFATKITTLEQFFGKECQNKIRETLEKVYTIMQSVTPTLYHNYVMKGGEFKNFSELYNRCCQDKGIFKDTPSMVQNITFFRDITKSNNYTARSKAIVMEDKASALFGNYTKDPVMIGEVSSKHKFDGVECYTPYLAYITLATLMAPLSNKQVENIMTNLATKIGKALKEVNLRDMLKYKTFLHDQIDLATGAKKDFNFEEWVLGDKQSQNTNRVSNNINAFQSKNYVRGRKLSRGRSRTRSRTNSAVRSKSRSSQDRSKWFNNLFDSLPKEDQLKMAAFYADNQKKKGIRKNSRSNSKGRKGSRNRFRNVNQEEQDGDEQYAINYES